MWERKELDKLMSESKFFKASIKTASLKVKTLTLRNVIHKVDDEICPGTSVRDELTRLHPESKDIKPSSV
ncbi:hypothetical protein GJ496_009125 [Pomphorhynchus laevis]|nr:hypothetical protein GJ496_009125 [Pomphorhynchus laevis]